MPTPLNGKADVFAQSSPLLKIKPASHCLWQLLVLAHCVGHLTLCCFCRFLIVPSVAYSFTLPPYLWDCRATSPHPASLLIYQPLALGGGLHYPAPFHATPAFFGSSDKTHTQSLFLYNLTSWHSSWALVSPSQKSMPLPIYYVYLSTCPKLQWLVPLAPAKHPWPPACSSGHRPQLPQRPHMAAVLFSLQRWQKLLFPSSCLLFLLGSGSSACTFHPAIGPLDFFTDKLGSRTLASEPLLQLVSSW